MKTVNVKTPSKTYDVKIGPGLLPTLGAETARAVKAKKCVIVTGENVFPLYGAEAAKSLEEAGLHTETIVFPAGEETKCLQRYAQLLDFLAQNRLSRSDCVVALGGGVTGDLAGFAAATYQRGIPYIQVPTTLLAAVDSSVGGKTAIDLPAGKNQVGAFHQPSLVLCDTDTLSTLPDREMRAGYAEIIKYAVLQDADLFDTLQHADGSLAGIIESCVQCKAQIVAEDEKDTGRRRLLNLGHTFGHAVESRSGYQLLHGEAVAIGLAVICRAAAAFGRLDGDSCQLIIDLLRSYGLPTEAEYTAAELYDTLLLDKKFSGGLLYLVVPKLIGWCELVPVTPEELRRWLDAGLSEY